MKNTVLVIVSIALAPGWALAQNGVVLINQSTVAASGANRSTGGFPYVIAQPGSYQLSSNLTVPAGVSGIQISASFVSLDLNGFTISNLTCAFPSCTAAGITDNATQQSGITIRNGTVLGFYDGIGLGASTGSFIEKVNAQSNMNNGIRVFNSSTVKDCIALSNGFSGIFVGSGIVSGSVASGNNVGFVSALGSTLTGNTASANINIGFEVFCPVNLVGNTAVGGTPETQVGAGCNKVNNLGF